jgi:catechol 2,3-dioxygenase-like lactoylglutathione lyase family enzyme
MAFVADMDQATSFYRGTLGLPLKFASPTGERSSPLPTELATGQTTLMLHPASDEHLAGTFGVGLRAPDLAAFCDDLTHAGVICTQPPTPQFGAPLARFRDAEGTEFTVGADPAPGSALSDWTQASQTRGEPSHS